MSLRSLSDQEILSRIHKLTARERSLTRLVLLHLNEIERRRLHLKLGYASMFDYCTSGLGYSSSAAARRIRTARCVARFPEVFALLEKNEVNLSTVSQVSRVLSVENREQLLARIRGKSQREVDAIVAEYEPRSMPPDRVRAVAVRVPVDTPATEDPTAPMFERVGTVTSSPTNGMPAVAGSEHCRSGSAFCASRSDALPSRRQDCVVTERRLLLSFSASEAFMAKLEKIKSLVWHRLPANPSLEQVFELAMDCLIQKEDPRESHERREVHKEAKNEARSRGRQRGPGTRYIAASVKDEVFNRDKGRCTYVGASGRRCASARALQVDHVMPIARGGRGTPGNLRLLCAYHNRLEAERILGAVCYARKSNVGATTDSSPTLRAPGSSRGRPSPAPP